MVEKAARRSSVTIRPVTPDRLDDLARVFDTNRTARGCWCMYFRGRAKDFSDGWHTGGNRTRFEELAGRDDLPQGLLAYDGDEPIAWCAVGPRSRYDRAISPRAVILKERDPAEDDAVWLVPCFFVRTGFRKQGVTYALLEAAVALAREHGASAVEGFPLSGDKSGDADGYLGRESLFAACGFRAVAQPSPRRTVMRIDLRPDRTGQEDR